MHTNTTNYNLVKPDPSEFYNVEVQNDNLDIIDAELKRIEEDSGGVVQLQQELATHKADDVLHNISVKVIKLNKDAEGVFTTIEHRRKSDNTLARKSVLSGGSSPRYSTRTVTYYKVDGTTIVKTDVFALSYDSDGDFVSEV